MSETTPAPETALVEPRTLKGFQDILPEDMIARNALTARITGVYEKYGFAPLETPILEHLSTLVGTGGEETNKQLFRLESPEREAIAMRFDLTVPFARLLAQYPEKLKLPFRRYHVGPVFRADKPGPGRFRQFTQVDIDAAGSDCVAVDAEIVAAMAETLRSLGLANANAAAPDFQIKVNNRKLADALLAALGIGDVDTERRILRAIDKLPKVGIENVRRELGPGRIDESGDPIQGVKLPADVITKILDFIAITGTTRRNVLAAVAAALPASEKTSAALAEMEALAAALDALAVPESDALFDPSLARGLDYYSGPIFEAVLPNAPQVGSIMGGGRYDQLVARFMNSAIPSTGASIGLDRMLAGLQSLGLLSPRATLTQVLVVSIGAVPATAMLAVAAELRAQGICTEAYFGAPKTSLKNQLSLANARAIPVAVVVGEDELKAGTISIKDLAAGSASRAAITDHQDFRQAGKASQVTVPRADLVATVKSLLGSQA